MPVPVTILCGELGAGKTTLLSSLLESSDRKIAVLVNDVGEVNVDADLIKTRTELATDEEVVALENGCICCSLGDELSQSVIQLWKEHEFDYLVVEASGVSEPIPIAQQFVRPPAGGPYDLDAVVTVVDARRFFDTFAGVEATATPTRDGPDETGARPLADLLLEQVEFCDLLVVNKCDLVTTEEREHVVALLETLQPRAEIVTTEYSSIEPESVLESDRFDFDAARKSANWIQLPEAEERDYGDEQHNHHHDDHDHHQGSEHEHVHPPERYGIQIESYHRRRPFHPERLNALLSGLPAELVRAKGQCWIAGREQQAIMISYAGTETTLEVTGRWVASYPDSRQKTYRRSHPDLSWDEECGDREVRLVLIGREIDMTALQSRFDECLLTDAEMDEDWSSFANQVPSTMDEMLVVSTADDATDRPPNLK